MQNTKARSYVELAALTAAAVAAYVVAARVDVFDHFVTWSREHEQLAVEELFVASVVAVVGLALFGWRRYREAQSEATRLGETRQVLQETSDRYRSLFTHNPHGVYSLDRDGHFVSVNEAAQTLTGFDEEGDLVGRRFAELIAPDALDRTMDVFEGALSGRPQQAQTAILRSNGERVELSVWASPIVVRGEVVGVYGVAEDITERRRLERDLQRTQAAVAAALDEVLICDEDGRIVYANEASVRLHGHESPVEMLGEPFESFLDDSGRQRLRSEVLPALDREARWGGQLTGRRRDGTTYALEASFARIGDGGLVAIGRDATARVETEAALRRSEERRRLLARVTRDVIWDADLVTGRTTWSGAVEEVLGFSREALELDDAWWQSRLHPDDAAAAVASSEAALASGSDQWAHEFRLRDAADRYVAILSRFRILRDENGRPIRLLGSMIDVTERRRHEEELRIARRAAEEANEAKSLFLANISHEIRTPLTSVIAGTEMIMETPLTPDQARLTATVHRSGERLLRLVDDLLDFSRIEAGEMRVDAVPFDPRSVARQLAGWAAEACADKDLEFRLEVSEEVPATLIGDPERLAQVLTNLLDNAVKFTADGHVRLAIAVDGSDSRTMRLRYTVEDTGPGIDPRHHADIFRSFSQADPSITRSHGGSGLGLAIAQQITEALGGTIRVDSEPDRGSRFSVELPFPMPAPA